MDIKVISSEIDGARLRKEKSSKYYSVCDGSKDNDNINEALSHKGGGWSVPREAWERIFGGEK